jgi:hypothetical protein
MAKAGVDTIRSIISFIRAPPIIYFSMF